MTMAKQPLPHGRCPICGEPGVLRERRPDGNDRCKGGHEYPSADAVYEQAELHPAYEWQCDACGSQNFESGIVHEFSAEETAELREEYDVEPWETGSWVSYPVQVICRQCGTTYDAKHWGDDDDEDEGEDD